MKPLFKPTQDILTMDIMDFLFLSLLLKEKFLKKIKSSWRLAKKIMQLTLAGVLDGTVKYYNENKMSMAVRTHNFSVMSLSR